MRRRTSILMLAAAFLLFVWLLFAILQGRPWQIFQDPQRLGEWLRRWGRWAPLAVVLTQATQVLLAPIPGNVVALASGYLLGVGWGTFYSVVGTSIGSLLAFVLVRRYGRPLVERLVPAETLVRLDAGASRQGLFFFVLVFLLPFLPDDLACLAAGLTAIPIPALMLAVLLGRPPGIFVSVWLGATATELSRGQWTAVGALSLLVAALFLLYGVRLQALALNLLEKLSRPRD